MHCHEVELGNYCHGKKMGTWEDFTRIHTLMHGNMATMISPMHLPHYEGFFGFFYFEISRWCKPQDGATVEILPAKFIYRDVLSKNSFRKFSSFFCRVVLEICDSSFLELSKIRELHKAWSHLIFDGPRFPKKRIIWYRICENIIALFIKLLLIPCKQKNCRFCTAISTFEFP